ncbi:MAG: Rne/Rng family ribonuclease [Gemmatimonadota bacterium]|nr:Rne/Rng family ribonuclease [Gemmatimonadota bacterium]MDH3367839.1 Rne/Rng family ribonuclease [Gemmatimonadota bacterium]MDH3479174.1 Rne/Rng family ribonuclease [Gemmatimonadota bacterium]MDH3570854.1 Rne/Rng family ribonuclease [Gemmatimonadota bacterium]MDH5548603.1 Rne/Rng family ribonuclease [Gemmatimonadota bacterium]
MKREILINAGPRETRVAILEDDRLVEVLHDRPDIRRTVGNIYLGKVEAVLPGMQAAFVDIGTGKSAFLHASDLIEPDEDDEDENGRPRRNGRRLPNIQDHMKRGESLLVQVTKEPIGTKGPRVTRQISLAGRFLVYMPYASKIGVSRKIGAREERQRLREMVGGLLPKDSGGVIVRTVAEDLTDKKVKVELKSLLDQWKKIKRKAHFVRLKAPAPVYRETSLTSGIIRDVFSDKVDRVIVDSKELLKEIKGYLRNVEPELIDRLSLAKGSEPLFDEFDIETEIQSLFDRRVDLPTGGYVIIEPTEALVSIDVNTGRYTGQKDPEKTILRTNMEATREIARQVRLRDLGGIIVIDFIDMDVAENRDKVMHELRSHLARDRARTRAFHLSELGLVEMTRQRVRPSLFDTMAGPCPACDGVGRVFRPGVVVRRLERALRRVAAERKETRLTVRVHPEVALYLMEVEPLFLKQRIKETGMDLELRDDPIIQVDQFRLMAQPAGRDVTQHYAVA